MTREDPFDDLIDPIKLATARRLRALHEQQPYPESGICAWCLKRWPCPDRRWADRIERTAVQQFRAEDARNADPPSPESDK